MPVAYWIQVLEIIGAAEWKGPACETKPTIRKHKQK